MTKKLICVLMCLNLLLALCACGEAPAPAEPETSAVPEATAEPTPEPTPEPTEKPALRQSTLPGAGLHEAEEPEEDELAARIAEAQRFVDGPVEALIKELGEPLSRDYASSCLGSGQDGELHYEGFTVYTYRSDDAETVTGIE